MHHEIWLASDWSNLRRLAGVPIPYCCCGYNELFLWTSLHACYSVDALTGPNWRKMFGKRKKAIRLWEFTACISLTFWSRICFIIVWNSEFFKYFVCQLALSRPFLTHFNRIKTRSRCWFVFWWKWLLNLGQMAVRTGWSD